MLVTAGQDRVADFEMKLMEIEQEQLGIPDQDYSAQVRRAAHSTRTAYSVDSSRAQAEDRD